MRSLLLVLFLFPFCIMASQSELVWITSPEKAFEISKASGKIVFADVFATWCPPCKKLEKETFIHSEFKKIAASFILLKVDVDKNKEFAKRYGVRGVPTMLFLNAKGEALHQIVGFRSAERLVPEMKNMLKKAGSVEEADKTEQPVEPVAEVKELPWLKDKDKALAMAKEQKRMIFVDMYTDWCGWCKKLDKDVFMDPEFQKIALSFVLLKLNGDEESETVQKYEVSGYPTLLFLDAEGKLVEKVVGYRKAAELIEFMQKLLAK